MSSPCCCSSPQYFCAAVPAPDPTPRGLPVPLRQGTGATRQRQLLTQAEGHATAAACVAVQPRAASRTAIRSSTCSRASRYRASGMRTTVSPSAATSRSRRKSATFCSGSSCPAPSISRQPGGRRGSGSRGTARHSVDVAAAAGRARAARADGSLPPRRALLVTAHRPRGRTPTCAAGAGVDDVVRRRRHSRSHSREQAAAGRRSGRAAGLLDRTSPTTQPGPPPPPAGPDGSRR